VTVIAWDGKTLAADKRAVSGGGIARTCTKIQRHEACLIAMTGDWDVAAELREWFKAGADPDKFPKEARDDKSTLIVIDRQNGIRSWSTGPYPLVIESERCCWGTGRDYAEAAMYLGHDARKGVEVACVFQTDCGSGIDCLTLGEA
jgi:hypothetical protein